MAKSYKEMNYQELVVEINRVRNLLNTNKNHLTQKQNKKYLQKLLNEFYAYKHYRDKITM